MWFFLLIIFFAQLLIMAFGFWYACKTVNLLTSQIFGVVVCILLAFVFPFSFFTKYYILNYFTIWSVIFPSYYLLFLYEGSLTRTVIISSTIIALYLGGFIRWILLLVDFFVPIDIFSI